VARVGTVDEAAVRTLGLELIGQGQAAYCMTGSNGIRGVDPEGVSLG